MRRNYDLILSAEGKLSRLIAPVVLAKRPLTVWHYSIPDMFIIVSLRRSSEMNGLMNKL